MKRQLLVLALASLTYRRSCLSADGPVEFFIEFSAERHCPGGAERNLAQCLIRCIGDGALGQQFSDHAGPAVLDARE